MRDRAINVGWVIIEKKKKGVEAERIVGWDKTIKTVKIFENYIKLVWLEARSLIEKLVMRQEEKGRDVNVETVEMRYILRCRVCALLCPILCGPMDCSLPGSSVHGASQARIQGVGGHFLFQGVFRTTQGLNPYLVHLLHWQADSLLLCYLGSPKI